MGRNWSLSFAELIKSARTLRSPPPPPFPAAEQSKQPALLFGALSSRSLHQPPSPTCAGLGRKGGIIKIGGDAEIIKIGGDAQGRGWHCHLWDCSGCSNEHQEQQCPGELHKQKYQLFIQFIFSTLKKLGKGRRLTYLPVWEEQCSREKRLSPEQLWDMRAGSDLPIRVKKSSFPFWSKPNEHLAEQFEANS